MVDVCTIYISQETQNQFQHIIWYFTKQTIFIITILVKSNPQDSRNIPRQIINIHSKSKVIMILHHNTTVIFTIFTFTHA